MRQRKARYVAQYKGLSGRWIDIGTTVATYDAARKRADTWLRNPLVDSDRVVRICRVDYMSYGPTYTEVTS